MTDHAGALRRHLGTLKALRGEGGAAPERLSEVKAWQSRRLASSYADVSTVPRYRAATAYFLEDLYGPHDFTRRDQSMLSVLPVMSKMLPASAVETAALAIELEALSEDLDHRLARALKPGPIDEASYAAAYRASGTRAERERQVELIVLVGERLDALVQKPFVFRMLRLMRKPARLAGMDDLQDFLERGFHAFREMGGAGDFLSLVRSRETTILNRLFSGAPEPFSL